MIGTPSSRVGYVQPIPEAELTEICEEAAAADDGNFFDALAKQAAEEAMKPPFLW